MRRRPRSRKVSPKVVLGVVADAFEMNRVDLGKRGYDCVARAVAAQMLVRYAGMNQRDIGGLLGMGTGVAVCLQLKRLRICRLRDSGLELQIEGIESALEKGKSIA